MRHSRWVHYILVLGGVLSLLAVVMALLYFHEAATYARSGIDVAVLRASFLKLFAVLALIGGVATWWLMLAHESRQVAQEESERQTQLLLREIAAHKKTDEQLKRAKEAAENENLAKSRFMSGMSHELRTPLNSILGYTQIMARDPAFPEHWREATDVIHRSGTHLLGLIDGLLDIAGIEAGKLKLEYQELRLPEFLDQIVMMLKPQVTQKGLQFNYAPSDKLPRIVQIDEKRLRQILINLLSNAVKFTQEGHVSLRVRYNADIAQFEIADSGAGIPPADLERIFLPYERSWAGEKRTHTGSGLGLTICRTLTDIMGGELTVKSTLGQGSVFTLKLFLPAVRAPRIGVLPQGRIVGYQGQARRVLTVDDEASQRRIIRDMLEPLGFLVHEAADGASALDMVGALAPDLILMDISMPDMPGWEVCRKMRANGVRVPIIVVSANAYARSDLADMSDAHTDFLPKPIIMNELLDQMGHYMGLCWEEQANTTVAPVPEQAELHRVALRRDHAEALLELGAMGYIKGILERLEVVREDQPEAAVLVDHLLKLTSSFQLGEYQSTLKRHMQHHAPKT